MTSSSTDPITLREAAQRLRVRNESMDWGEAAGLQEELNDQHAALATLLDGDGEGGLLGEHKPFDGCCECSPCWRPETHPKAQVCVGTACPTLTLVAAYVSAVLGQEVQP